MRPFIFTFRIEELSKEKTEAVSEHLQTIKQLSTQNETIAQSFKVRKQLHGLVVPVYG